MLNCSATTIRPHTDNPVQCSLPAGHSGGHLAHVGMTQWAWARKPNDPTSDDELIYRLRRMEKLGLAPKDLIESAMVWGDIDQATAERLTAYFQIAAS